MTRKEKGFIYPSLFFYVIIAGMDTIERTDFYVYIFISKSDNITIRYVGKGSGNRIYDNTSRKYKVPEKNRIKVVEGLTEQEAFMYERFLISLYGRIDLGTGTLTNLTDGGDGMAGASPETRKKLSDGIKKAIDEGRFMTPEHKEKIIAAIRTPERRAKVSKRMKGNTHRLGIPHDEDSKAAMSKASLARSAAGLHWAQQEENKQLLSERVKGEKNPMYGATGDKNPFYGKQHPPELMAQIAQKNKSEYVFEDPEGNFYREVGLKDFCKKHDLDHTCMGYVIAGTQPFHNQWRGWTVEEFDAMDNPPKYIPIEERGEKRKFYRSYAGYTLVAPDGTCHVIEDKLTPITKQLGIHAGSVMSAIRKNKRTSNGYTIIPPDD